MPLCCSSLSFEIIRNRANPGIVIQKQNQHKVDQTILSTVKAVQHFPLTLCLFKCFGSSVARWLQVARADANNSKPQWKRNSRVQKANFWFIQRRRKYYSNSARLNVIWPESNFLRQISSALRCKGDIWAHTPPLIEIRAGWRVTHPRTLPKQFSPLLWATEIPVRSHKYLLFRSDAFPRGQR